MRYVLTPFFVFLMIIGFGQKSPDAGFIEHLMNREYHKEVVHLLDEAEYKNASPRLQDSLNYMKGWSLYSLKELKRSAHALKLVSSPSPFYHKSRFFAAYNHAHLTNYKKALETLENIKTTDDNLQNLKHFEKSGIALLQRDYKAFDQQFDQVDTSYYPIAKASGNMERYAQKLKAHNKKSPWVAGMMSALVPGSGKIYAGKTGQGISSFLTVGGMGFVTWENYRKNGWKDFKTLFFATVFSAFYAGNIHGTVMTVKITENEFQKEYDNKILFHLHIPLRNVFN
ncbi:MAG: hypothetical protein K9J27_03825 [Bacteroidales bacterium]|nr:hypothetical protein [Bacteroidales bacterium]MCF8333230.1 hypothetical protein [Bacteroidales bacterium]